MNEYMEKIKSNLKMCSLADEFNLFNFFVIIDILTDFYHFLFSNYYLFCLSFSFFPALLPTTGLVQIFFVNISFSTTVKVICFLSFN